MTTYTDEEKTAIGKQITEIFMMRKSENKGRFLMTWGDKYPLGVFETFMRIAKDIESANFSPHDYILSPKSSSREGGEMQS
jgi:hypothetical protein